MYTGITSGKKAKNTRKKIQKKIRKIRVNTQLKSGSAEKCETEKKEQENSKKGTKSAKTEKKEQKTEKKEQKRAKLKKRNEKPEEKRKSRP